MEDLNDKLDDDKYYGYSPLNINTNRNILKRAINDPEIKDIQLFINNFQQYSKRHNKRQKSIKFSINLKSKNEKDALLNKMMNKNNSEKIYNNLKNMNNNNNHKSILKNLNNHFSILKHKSNSIENVKVKNPLINNKNNNNSSDETRFKRNLKNHMTIKENKMGSLNNIKPLKVIRQYSFKYKTNRNNKNILFRRINKSLLNYNNNSKKDSLIFIP